MQRISARNVLSLSALALFVSSGMLYAGPLNPPAGPVASTFKTLTEVEPRIAINATNTPGDADSLYKITQAGSYYLTGNIIGVAGKHGIEVAGNGITIDLNGFQLAGAVAMGSFDGVSATLGALSNITVKNGSIIGWGDMGIDFGTNNVTNCRISDVDVTGNLGAGMAVGTNAVVTNCSALLNTNVGFSAHNATTFTGCVAARTTGAGVGISTGVDCVLTSCTAMNNSGNGINAGASTTIDHCTSGFNAGVGIYAANSCAVTDSTARENGSDGILADVATSIRGCTLIANASDGIQVSRRCTIAHNLCVGNGPAATDGAGIHVTGSGNHLESNDCLDNDRGIDIDVTSNFVTRNTCAGNVMNWDVVAGNFCLVVLANAGAGVAGNSGGGPLGSTDPNANFTY